MKCFPPYLPPPRDQTKPFAYSCSFTLHTSYKNGLIGHVGEHCQNAQKQLIRKTYLALIMYKPVGVYQFTMACIRASVLIGYQLINWLFLNRNIGCGYSKELK